MRLHRTREEWAKIKPDGRWYHQREKMALEDIATLFVEVERLKAPSPPTLDREALARVIDPGVFMWVGDFVADGGTLEDLVGECNDMVHRIQSAYSRADQIIAMRAALEDFIARRFDQCR